MSQRQRLSGRRAGQNSATTGAKALFYTQTAQEGNHGSRLLMPKLRFLGVRCGFSLANFAVKGSCFGGNQKTLTAKDAKKGREARGEIQIEASPGAL